MSGAATLLHLTAITGHYFYTATAIYDVLTWGSAFTCLIVNVVISYFYMQLYTVE